MIVVHPNGVARLYKFGQAVGEFRADASISGERIAIEVEQVKAIME